MKPPFTSTQKQHTKTKSNLNWLCKIITVHFLCSPNEAHLLKQLIKNTQFCPHLSTTIYDQKKYYKRTIMMVTRKRIRRTITKDHTICADDGPLLYATRHHHQPQHNRTGPSRRRATRRDRSKNPAEQVDFLHHICTIYLRL